METKLQVFFLSVLYNVSGEVHAGSVISVIWCVYVCTSDVMETVLFISFTIRRGAHCGYGHGRVMVRESILYWYVNHGASVSENLQPPRNSGLQKGDMKLHAEFP